MQILMFSFKNANKYCHTTDLNVVSYIFTFSRHLTISQCQMQPLSQNMQTVLYIEDLVRLVIFMMQISEQNESIN